MLDNPIQRWGARIDWSVAHVHRYLAEFDFRYLTKAASDSERADPILKGIVAKRLTYRRINRLAA